MHGGWPGCLTCPLCAARCRSHDAQVRLACVPNAVCLASLVAFLYLDATETDGSLTPDLHRAALACGLDRLVLLCEARFGRQLELQLTSWQGACEQPACAQAQHDSCWPGTLPLTLPPFMPLGLSKEQQEGVLDSFIGWTRYADALERADLKQLCVHALARHVTAATSRWEGEACVRACFRASPHFLAGQLTHAAAATAAGRAGRR